MDQRRFSLVPDSKDIDNETNSEDKPSKVGEMGFYETVASGQASASNWRAFCVSKDNPSSDDLLEEKGKGQGEELTHVTGSLTTPQVKLPLISNTAVIANSSSN